MTDKQHTSGRPIEEANIIDMEMKEVHLSNEELAANYVDTKQADQFLIMPQKEHFTRLLEKWKKTSNSSLPVCLSNRKITI